MVTTLKPDLVIIDRQRKSLEIFELTVPGETRISTAHNLKFQKYQHFCSDINTYKVSVIPFEIGSHTAYVSRENIENLNKLHKFCKIDLELKSFKKNIPAITVLGSYFLFNNRNIETWHTPSNYIYVPMTNMWIVIIYLHYLYKQKRNQDIPAGGSMERHFNLPLRFQASLLNCIFKQ